MRRVTASEIPPSMINMTEAELDAMTLPGLHEIVAARGLEIVSDDGALMAAIDEALAADPDVLEKIREGKVQAAGAIIGAVMKAMKGQADAARVRELIIERAAAS